MADNQEEKSKHDPKMGKNSESSSRINLEVSSQLSRDRSVPLYINSKMIAKKTASCKHFRSESDADQNQN